MIGSIFLMSYMFSVRDRLHHLKFLRDKMAHFPAPSIAECLAGAMAASDILVSHSIPAARSLQTCVHHLRTLMPTGDQLPLSMKMPKRPMLFAVADKAFETFVDEVGGKARIEWADKTKKPADLNEIQRLVRYLQAQDGRNQQLKNWVAYRTWNYDSVKDSLESIKTCRDIVNHEPLKMSAEIVCDLLRSTSRVLDALAMDKACWEKLLEFMQAQRDFLHCADCDHIPLRVNRGDAAADMRMQIGFSARQLVGRDPLIAAVTADILERVKRGEHSRTLLFGQSGVGKTVLAREICNKLLEALPLQVMLLGTSGGTMRLELARHGRAFTPSLSEQADEEQAVDAALSFFASITGYVLLVDDAVDIAELWPLLPGDASGRQTGHILFTTQQRSGWTRAELLTSTHEVGALSTDEALEMLESRGRDDARVTRAVMQDGEIDLRRFVERDLGNLPLAVSMAKSALQGLNVQDAREVMIRIRQSLVDQLGGYRESRYLRTLDGLVQELIEVRLRRRCGEDGVLYSTATRLLSMLCVLDSDGVPDELMTSACESPAAADFWRSIADMAIVGLMDLDCLNEQVSVLINAAEDLFERSIAILVNIGLVDSDRLNKFNSMHALYQRCIFHYFQRGREVSLLSWGFIWRGLETQFILFSQDAKAHSKRLLRLLGAARCAAYCSCDKAAEQKQGKRFLQLAKTHRARLHSAVGIVGTELSHCHDWKTAEHYLESALEIHITEHGPDHPDVATSLNKLAILHRVMGQHMQALLQHERALAISEATLGPNHPAVAENLNDFAVLLQAMGQHEQALPLYERALAIGEATFGPDHPHVAACLSNLATLLTAMGQYEQALPLHERALAISEATLAPNHPDLAARLNCLALLHQAMGQYEQALPLQVRALAIKEATLGPNHPHVATSLSNLASLLKDMVRHEQALPLHERALAITEATLGPNHPKVASSLNNLAMLHNAMGQHEQALPLHERALAIQEATLGPSHPEVATSLNNLAMLYQTMGQYEQALSLHERALAIREATLGPNHPHVAISLCNRASLHQIMGQHEQALPLHERALAIREATLGPNHPEVAASVNYLSLLYQDMGHRYRKRALSLHERAITIKEATLGPNHPEVVFIRKMQNLAHTSRDALVGVLMQPVVGSRGAGAVPCRQGQLACVGCGRQAGWSCKCGAMYCSAACQKADWSSHKRACAWHAAKKRAEKAAAAFHRSRVQGTAQGRAPRPDPDS
jgi:tetratricopeptide (TPR) repeat protein